MNNRRNFREMLKAQWANDNFVCVGLDSDWGKIPDCLKASSIFKSLFVFNKRIVEATCDLICAFKLNIAFYEAHGAQGVAALRESIDFIQANHSEIPVILDFKRADIGNTNAGYAKAAFEYFRADGVTVNPYFGGESLQLFLEQADKGIIVLCRTSNPGAGEFQDLLVNGVPLYQIVARQVATAWNKNGNCAVVVGATCPEELGKVRGIVGDMPILIPAVGAQGGDVEKTVAVARDSRGEGMIINASRSIIFASSGENFADAARRETIKLRDAINQCRWERG